MDVTEESRDIITKEIKFVLEKMSQSETPTEALYYFSGIPGVIQRVYNIEYDPDLVYTHFILRQTYEAFLTRLNIILERRDQVVPLSDKHFEKLLALTKQLAKKIAKNSELDDTLKKYVMLIYSTTGNGYYLQQKGLLKI